MHICNVRMHVAFFSTYLISYTNPSFVKVCCVPVVICMSCRSCCFSISKIIGIREANFAICTIHDTTRIK